MKIEFDYEKLKMFFATLIENNVGCNECPFMMCVTDRKIASTVPNSTSSS